ncbi:MAG: molybdenum cofactor biosynthesis protein B [Hyphomicrobiaceae bacterium]|nr:molybdenum cofactor biosynthesis protein B [Hyphomicrobiaceae bacterium]
MPGIDEKRDFHPLHIAVLTISDTRTKEDDRSGDRLEKMLTEAGHSCISRQIITDDKDDIQAAIKKHIHDTGTDVVITTGGTGLTGRDVTVEAVTPLYDKKIDGFSVLMHMLSYQTVGTSTMASRACAGLANGTMLFSLPGSPGACKDAWNGILVHQLDSRHGPCNLVALMPRFLET